MKPYKDYSGETFGRWTVIEEAEPKMYRGRRLRYWKCKCECGTVKDVKEALLKRGSSKSCGCYHSDVMRDLKPRTTHGMVYTRLYRIYRHMIMRCTNPNDIRYPQYGGRGIKVCDRWLDFSEFSKWAIENGYDDSLSIDRIDVDGDYAPENCKWSTCYEQSINKTSTHYVEYNGVKKSIAEWAREYGMPYKKLHKRIQNGWPAERALLT